MNKSKLRFSTIPIGKPRNLLIERRMNVFSSMSKTPAIMGKPPIAHRAMGFCAERSAERSEPHGIVK